MAVLWPLSRTRETDDNGRPLGGAKAYFFDADTTTPRVVYQDGSLSTPHTHPVVADGFGRWPAVFLQAGEYRVRVTTSAGVTLFDDDNIDPTTEIEGGEDVVDEDALYQTGDFVFNLRTGARPGFVRANARTIGSGASGASERANDDCEDLYTYLWNNLSDTVCPVDGGRSSTAAADWAANKPIATPDFRGRAPFGLDDMGNSAAGVITSGTTVGGGGGDEQHTLTTDEMPSHTHSVSGSTGTAGAHSHAVGDAVLGGPVGGTGLRAYTGVVPAYSTTDGAHNHSVSGTAAEVGGDGSHNNMPPYTLGTWYIKL